MNDSRSKNSSELTGNRLVLHKNDSAYPNAFRVIPKPPDSLYIIGNPEALEEGLSVVGARRATPYGRTCTEKFAAMAAKRGVCIISGGALGCDSIAHKTALANGAKTVVFLGGGCDQVYPAGNFKLFQQVIDCGGAVVSEHDWQMPALPYQFRSRNRLIAALGRATLIVEAGLPSGTFTTADYAIEAGREVLVVPGSIASPHSQGANRLLYQGAIPVVDEQSFDDILDSLFGMFELRQPDCNVRKRQAFSPLIEAVLACPMSLEQMYEFMAKSSRAKHSLTDLMPEIYMEINKYEKMGVIARYPSGQYGPAVG